jgi:hypothetical protein
VPCAVAGAAGGGRQSEERHQGRRGVWGGLALSAGTGTIRYMSVRVFTRTLLNPLLNPLFHPASPVSSLAEASCAPPCRGGITATSEHLPLYRKLAVYDGSLYVSLCLYSLCLYSMSLYVSTLYVSTLCLCMVERCTWGGERRRSKMLEDAIAGQPIAPPVPGSFKDVEKDGDAATTAEAAAAAGEGGAAAAKVEPNLATSVSPADEELLQVIRSLRVDPSQVRSPTPPQTTLRLSPQRCGSCAALTGMRAH